MSDTIVDHMKTLAFLAQHPVEFDYSFLNEAAAIAEDMNLALHETSDIASPVVHSGANQSQTNIIPL